MKTAMWIYIYTPVLNNSRECSVDSEDGSVCSVVYIVDIWGAV